MKLLTTAAATAIIFAAAASAGVRDVNNTADVLHPNIHQNVTGGNNANPGRGNDNGNNLHGIANVPGQGGDNPNDDGVNGQANELQTTHGGIGAKNKNAR